MTCTAALACIIIGSGPASVTLTATPDGYAVTYRNTIVSSLTVTPWAMELDGMAVRGQISAGDGEAPDDLQVVPPVGWQCGPCTVTVREGESGAVMLTPVALS